MKVMYIHNSHVRQSGEIVDIEGIELEAALSLGFAKPFDCDSDVIIAADDNADDGASNKKPRNTKKGAK